MRRTARGWLLIALGVWLLLIAASTAWHGEDLAAGAAAEPALSDNRYQIETGRYVVIGVLVYDKQTGAEIPIYYGSYGPALPTATPGTVPTETPELTATPPPTNTPRPSATSVPTATPGTVPTPTPDTAPQPTPADDGEKLCLVKVRGTAINERVEPRTNAPKTSTSPIPAGSTVKVLEVQTAEGYLWGRNAFGWFVLREGASWWVDGLEGATELCKDVPGWPAGLEPPAPIARGMPGIWVGPGANRDELITFGVRVKAAGQQPAATVYGEPDAATILYAQGWHVALRAAGAPDCPEMDLAPAQSAQRFVTAVLDDVGTRAHAVVLTNECAWPSAVYARDWVRAAAVAAAERGVRALVPIVWNPGAPELDWVPVIAEAYRDAKIALLWGVNLYPARPGVPLSARGETLWTTWRYELYRWQLGGVPIVATEYARGDGSEPPEFGDVRTWWGVARGQLLWATAWYAAMPLGHWHGANLRGRLADLAAALL